MHAAATLCKLVFYVYDCPECSYRRELKCLFLSFAYLLQFKFSFINSVSGRSKLENELSDAVNDILDDDDLDLELDKVHFRCYNELGSLVTW